MELEVRHLRIVLAIAAAGSVSAAARLLQVPQPALSRQLQRIEAAAGAPLFTRTAAGLAVTDAGARFLERARGLVDGFDRLPHRPEPAGTVPATVRLATYCLPAGGLLQRIGPELGITSVHAVEMPPQQALDRLAAGEVDLATIAVWPHTPPLAVPPGVRWVQLVREPLALMLARGHPAAAEVDPPLRAFAGERWVARAGLVTTDAECRRAGFVPDIAFRSDDHGHYLALVGSGAAVAFCSPTTYVTGDIVIRHYQDPATTTSALAYVPARLPVAVARRSAEAIRRRLAERLAAAAA